MPVVSRAIGQIVLNSQERPPPEYVAPTTVMTTPSNIALLEIDSADRFNANGSQGDNLNVPTRLYNNFVIIRNQNLIQGAIANITLTSIRFPYAIPNVNQSNQSMFVNINGVSGTINVDFGFYDGDQLAQEIELQMNTLNPGVTVAYLPSGQFSFSYSGPAPTFSLALFNINPALAPTNLAINSTRSLLDLIGMPPNQFGAVRGNIVGNPLVGGVARLRYTDYIDIRSYALTNYQNVKDATSDSLSSKTAIICRLFIENEQSVSSPTSVSGTLPFVIDRQFINPKVMRWVKNSSVGQIDIALFDMYGNPLVTPLVAVSGPPVELFVEQPMQDFQITFHVSED